MKLYSSHSWSAKPYLSGSVGPFAHVFKALASNNSILAIVDHLNVWGLILIGLSLFLGVFAKLSNILGIILLLFYYLAYPPFAELKINMPIEGNYWIVNKNLIEMVALFVLYLFPSSNITGLDRYIFNKTNN